MKPSFATNGTFVYDVLCASRDVDLPLEPALRPLVGEHKEVRFAKFAPNADLDTETLSVQKTATLIDITDGFPAARPDSVRIDFAQLAELSSDSESAVWQLCNILFDAVRTGAGHLIGGMTDEQTLAFEPRLRKDAVKQFWVGIVNATCADQTAAIKSAEEKALLLLARGDNNAAAEVLVKAKNFRLATLVAQLPGSEHSRELMTKQIEVWKTRNDWSEMSDAVRALYSILAGEVCVVPGKNGAKEDRVSAFTISERFDLNWMQSLLLRLFFAGHDTIEEAVKAYVADLENGREVTLPTPLWVAPGTSANVIAGREDTLLGLLRLYSTTRADPADLEALFDAYTVSGSPVNSRLAWQLAIMLYAKGWTDYINHVTLDQLTRDFAAELENTNKFDAASWVLLHLTETQTREHMIKGLLFRNGAEIPDPDASDEPTETNVFDHLVQDYQIPENLLYEAKALYAKAALRRPSLQARYLLNAGLFDEAHDVLTSTIGPTAVIEEDYDELIDVLSHFPEGGSGVHGWGHGGAVYGNFARLVTMSLGRKSGPQGQQVMEDLKAGLKAMATADAKVKMTLEERVGMIEMGRILNEEVRDLGFRNDAAAGAAVGAAVMGEEMQVEGLFEKYRAAMGVVV
jgi:nuclear pore complex protein Nup98-Nup96